MPALNALFCGKQSVQLTARPISNAPASKAAASKFESANFATIAVECERSESEKSIVSKLLKKRSKADEEKQDRSLETSAELDEKSEWKSLISAQKANRREITEKDLDSDEEKEVDLRDLQFKISARGTGNVNPEIEKVWKNDVISKSVF